jgi:hypothetical protein
MFSNRILSTIALFLSIAFAPQALAQSPVVPKYTGDNLLFPDGFRTWIFVGSNVGLAYKEELAQMALRVAKQADKGMFHNIYINPEAYAHFRNTGEFPDPTILVMDMYAAAEKEPQHIVAQGSYDGVWTGNLVAVKNSAPRRGRTERKRSGPIISSPTRPIRRSRWHRRRRNPMRPAKPVTSSTDLKITSGSSSIRRYAI